MQNPIHPYPLLRKALDILHVKLPLLQRIPPPLPPLTLPIPLTPNRPKKTGKEAAILVSLVPIDSVLILPRIPPELVKVRPEPHLFPSPSGVDEIWYVHQDARLEIAHAGLDGGVRREADLPAHVLVDYELDGRVVDVGLRARGKDGAASRFAILAFVRLGVGLGVGRFLLDGLRVEHGKFLRDCSCPLPPVLLGSGADALGGHAAREFIFKASFIVGVEVLELVEIGL
jgi:hypothetical protein